MHRAGLQLVFIITKNYISIQTHTHAYKQTSSGCANHYHHDKNISALYVSNMQHLNGKQERSLEMQIVSQEYNPFLPDFIIVK